MDRVREDLELSGWWIEACGAEYCFDGQIERDRRVPVIKKMKN